MRASLEQRLQTDYHFSPTTASLAMKLHDVVKDKSYGYKMLGIVLSPFAACYPKTQEAVYEIMAMGPKEDAYKITMWKALDRRGLITVLAAYATGTGLQSMGVFNYFQNDTVEFIKHHMMLGIYVALAENAIVTTASYVTKKPLPRPLTLFVSLNPVLWLDTIRVIKNNVEKAGKAVSRQYDVARKQMSYMFTEFIE